MKDVEVLERLVSPESIVGSFEMIENHRRCHQPIYDDSPMLKGAVSELMSILPVTNPAQITELKNNLADIALGSGRFVIITGRCAEPVSLAMPIDRMAEQSSRELDLVAKSGLAGALHILRGRGQNAKPRSEAHETLPDGSRVVSFMGDAINAARTTLRTPDPSRMVAAAVQARDLENQLRNIRGEHIPAAHEALLMPYEMSFLAGSSDPAAKFLLSADLPWVGLRTNDRDSVQIDMISEISNPVGVKIGLTSDAEHVEFLSEKLNPSKEPGKIVFMIRTGIGNELVTKEILSSIKRNEPESVILYDIHGSTREIIDNGNVFKIRSVDDMIEGFDWLLGLCDQEDLALDGVHLETQPSDVRLECVDAIDQMPCHKGGVDPQLNPRQLERLLDSIAAIHRRRL